MIAIFVTINVLPGKKDVFVAALIEDAKGSTRSEPGCYRFDILQNQEYPNRLHLYEVYTDKEALEAHRQTPHMLKWLSTVEGWFDGSPEVLCTSTIFPSDNGWREQKECLRHRLSW